MKFVRPSEYPPVPERTCSVIRKNALRAYAGVPGPEPPPDETPISVACSRLRGERGLRAARTIHAASRHVVDVCEPAIRILRRDLLDVDVDRLVHGNLAAEVRRVLFGLHDVVNDVLFSEETSAVRLAVLEIV